MEVRYVKRFRMVFDLEQQTPVNGLLPDGFCWFAWRSQQADLHGRVLYQSFLGELDGLVFPTFRRFDSCLRLMRSVSSDIGFVPGATWLIGHKTPTGIDYAATISGLRSDPTVGAIQNVAVRREFRRRGIGRALVQQALVGFHHVGCRRVTLDVTAANEPAIDLYRKVGFEVAQTLYKETFLEK